MTSRANVRSVANKARRRTVVVGVIGAVGALVAAASPTTASGQETASAYVPWVSSPNRPCSHLDEPTGTAPKAARSVIEARNIDVPWGLAWLPSGNLLVGQRDKARVLVVDPGDGSRHVARNMKGVVPNGDQGGEAGMLGLALSPHFKRDHWVYGYYSSATDNRIARMKFSHGHLGAQHVIFTGIPRSLHHNGGRIAFGPDGMLYATTGDGEVPSRAQNKHALGGKILRMTPTGKPAPGNPFHHSVVYSYGHRNTEGLAWDAQGRLWETEFGDQTWDELNLILPGHNYGWPIVEGRSSDHRFTNPKTQWHTDRAGPDGIAIVKRGGNNVAYIGGLTGHRLWKVTLSGRKVTARHALFTNKFGRIRSVTAHGGSIWFTSSNTDGRATPMRGDDKLIRMPL